MRYALIVWLIALIGLACIQPSQVKEPYYPNPPNASLHNEEFFETKARLDAEDPLIREAVILELADKGIEAEHHTWVLLSDRMHDDVPYVRGSAVWAMDHIGMAWMETSHPIPIKPAYVMQADEPGVEIDDEIYKQFLAKLSDSEPRERLTAIVLIAEAGEAAVDHIDAILDALNDEDARVRYWAIGSIRRMAGDILSQTVPLIGMLDDTDAAVRANAIKAFSEMGPAAGIAFDEISRMLKDDDSPNVRAYAAYALGLIDPAGDKSVPVLIDAMEDEEKSVRWKAIVTLGEMGEAAVDAIPSLSDALVNEEPSTQGAVAETLGKIGPASVPALIGALESDDPSVPPYAAKALAIIGPEAEDAVPYLTEMLGYNSFELITAATEALSAIGPAAAPAAPRLIEIIDWTIHTSEYFTKEENKGAKNEETALVTSAAYAIGNIGPDAGGDSVPLLIELLLSRRWDMKVPAAYALGRLGPLAEDAVGALIFMLLENSAKIRYHVAEALGNIGPAAVDALPRLNEIASTDRNGEVRKAAEEAIARIKEG